MFYQWEPFRGADQSLAGQNRPLPVFRKKISLEPKSPQSHVLVMPAKKVDMVTTLKQRIVKAIAGPV